MGFQKATKKQAKLRLALSGPAGSGKTKSALRIATGIVSVTGGRIAFIDTEFKTARKYSDQFDFDLNDDLTPETPIQKFISEIQEAENSGYSVLIVDSMSHAWESLLETIEKVAKAKYNGNTWAAWKDNAGGKLQSDFINAILKSNLHIICCFRVKTEWVTESNDKGKVVPKRVGLSIKQREGIEYEFDILAEGTVDHYFTITKDRTDKFQDEIFEKPTEELGIELINWLNDGEVIKNYSKDIAECKSKDELSELWNKLDSDERNKNKNYFTSRHLELDKSKEEKPKEEKKEESKDKIKDELPEVKQDEPKEEKPKSDIEFLISKITKSTKKESLMKLDSMIDSVEAIDERKKYLELFSERLRRVNNNYEIIERSYLND